jgi:hypothetical protein
MVNRGLLGPPMEHRPLWAFRPFVTYTFQHAYFLSHYLHGSSRISNPETFISFSRLLKASN